MGPKDVGCIVLGTGNADAGGGCTDMTASCPLNSGRLGTGLEGAEPDAPVADEEAIAEP